MPIGLGARRGRAVTLEEGASPKAARCPACGEPLFVWLEIPLTRVAPASNGLLLAERALALRRRACLQDLIPWQEPARYARMPAP